MAKIYISSTFSDLVEYRKAAFNILCSMNHSVKAMEHYVATDQRPLDKCLADVEACDVYVGIFAWRYGFIPDPAQGNPERRSITELEYRRAKETGKSCLIYLLDENHPWPPPGSRGWPKRIFVARSASTPGRSRARARAMSAPLPPICSLTRRCAGSATQTPPQVRRGTKANAWPTSFAARGRCSRLTGWNLCNIRPDRKKAS